MVNNPLPTPINSQQTGFEIVQIIDYGGAAKTEKEVLEVKEGETALQLLQRSSEVKVKEYSFGSLVESINGITNGTDSKNWVYAVNGQVASVGASEYILKPNDEIGWSFETYEE